MAAIGHGRCMGIFLQVTCCSNQGRSLRIQAAPCHCKVMLSTCRAVQTAAAMTKARPKRHQRLQGSHWQSSSPYHLQGDVEYVQRGPHGGGDDKGSAKAAAGVAERLEAAEEQQQGAHLRA